mmetsp:Transcript_14870/g.17134  ORF Transcript_14870/g.17134 Transcript_14870/m.17134 type:complete len:98 (-) Transcript_14870:30-323(-)
MLVLFMKQPGKQNLIRLVFSFPNNASHASKLIYSKPSSPQSKTATNGMTNTFRIRFRFTEKHIQTTYSEIFCVLCGDTYSVTKNIYFYSALLFPARL